MLEVLAGPIGAALMALAAYLRGRPGKSQLDRIEVTLNRVDNTLLQTTVAGNTTAQGLNELREEVHRHFGSDEANFKDIKERLDDHSTRQSGRGPRTKLGAQPS